MVVLISPMKEANKITGANAGGPRQLPMRTRWAARVAQFHRSAASASRFDALRLGVFAPLRFTGVDFNAETQSRKDAERI